MIIRSDIENSAAKQLAADLCCTPDAFFRNENTVTLPKLVEGRRIFTKEPHFFRAATMGMGAVICANKAVEPFAAALAAEKSGPEICSAETISALNRELFSYGFCIGIFKQYYLPFTPYRPSVRHEGYTLTVFEGDDIEQLYRYQGFDNALLYKASGERRDIIAVCAVNGRRIMGIAGASCDSPSMAQIGIDVLPEYRGMGIGAALVSACAAEVFRSGYVPYYGTWSGNIISQRLAVRCGFYPAWCEMFSVPLEK